MGGGSSNNAAIKEQQKAAAESRYKDDLRSWRMEKGVNEINNLFDGTPLPGLRDMPTYQQGSTSYVPTSGNAGASLNDFIKGSGSNLASNAMNMFFGNGGGGSDNSGGSRRYGLGNTGSGEGSWVLKRGPGGGERVWVPSSGSSAGGGGGGKNYDLNRMLQSGIISQDEFNKLNTGGNGLLAVGNSTYDQLINDRFNAFNQNAGKGQYGISENTTPWVDNLADTYLKAYNDYYMPQLNQQYTDANKNLTYDLARAGLLRSSAAADTQSDLARQNAENTAMVKSQGDQGVAALKQKINSAKQDAINQLYSTENPEVAANQALSSIRTIQNEQPNYSPLGDMFKTAVVGLGGYQSGASDRNYYNTITGANRKAASTVNN